MNERGGVPEELVALALKHAPSEGNHATLIPQVRLVRVGGSGFPSQSRYNPSLCLVLQGEKEAMVGAQAFRFAEGQFLVVSVDMPITGTVLRASEAEPFLCLVLELEPALIFELARDLGAGSKRGAVPRGIFVDKAGPELIDAVLRLGRCLERAEEARVVAPLALREILFRLLGSASGAAIRQLGLAGSRTQRIAQAVALIRSRFDKALRTEDLARAAGMSPSSFHHHFRQVTALTPLQYQKELRLQEAHRMLATEGEDAASVAFRVGYGSASQFSREYARHFGLPPISHLRELQRMSPR
jgi:AraC-like DNA-binding protein